MADLLALLAAERAAAHGEVLRVDRDLAPVHQAEPGDDGRAGLAAVDVAAAEAADLLEGAGVEQQVEALARGVLALGVLAVARVVLGVARQLGGAHDRGADRLVAVAAGGPGRAGRLTGVDRLADGRGFHDVGHCLPPAFLAEDLSAPLDSSLSPLAPAPVTSSVTSVSPASTPAAGLTKILVTVPLTGEYT